MRIPSSAAFRPGWLLQAANGLDNGLGRTPAMGYNSWYDLMGSLTEANLKETVDAFVALGLPQLGYQYFNLDDDWASGRYANGTVYADATKFFKDPPAACRLCAQ